MAHTIVDDDFDVDADGALETLMLRIREHIAPTVPSTALADPDDGNAQRAEAAPDEEGARQPEAEQVAQPPAPIDGSVVRSLSLVTQHLQDLRTLLLQQEEWLHAETEQSAYSGQEMSTRLDRMETTVRETVARVDALAARVADGDESGRDKRSRVGSTDVDALATDSHIPPREKRRSAWSLLIRVQREHRPHRRDSRIR